MKASIPITFKCLKGVKKEKAAKAIKIKSAKTNQTALPEVPIEAEIKAFSNMKDLTSAKKGSLLGKAATFVVSGLLFIFAFGVAFSVKSAVIIFIAILIHELGHYLGMMIFNYKDISILFIPLLGAATIGKQEKTTPFKEIIIYLLGPAPGLLLGVFCIIISGLTEIEYLKDYAIFSLILNYLNLIPVFPLDGGRVFELLIFSRAAFLKTAFKIISVLVIGLTGLGFGDPIVTGFAVFIGIGVFFSIASSKGLSKLKKNVRNKKTSNSDEEILYNIFEQLKEKPFTATPFNKKFQIAKGILNDIKNPPPGAGITIASLALYFATIIIPILMLITYGVIKAISNPN